MTTVTCCHSSMVEHYRHLAEDAASDLAAEAAYNDTNVPIVDAFDLFDTIPVCISEGCDNSPEGLDSRCWPCTRVETLRRGAALRAQFPNLGRRSKGLRDRRYNA